MLYQPLIYIENNVGRRFTQVFNLFTDVHGWGAVFQNDIHSGMQRAQHGDEWWLTEVGGKGFALLTCDMAIVSSPSEREAVRKSGLRFVGFASGQYDAWTQLRAITRHWDTVRAVLDDGGPVIVKVYAGGTPPEVTRL